MRCTELSCHGECPHPWHPCGDLINVGAFPCAVVFQDLSLALAERITAIPGTAWTDAPEMTLCFSPQPDQTGMVALEVSSNEILPLGEIQAGVFISP